jgi:SagB-type dehydrogenase family enzyme
MPMNKIKHQLKLLLNQPASIYSKYIESSWLSCQNLRSAEININNYTHSPYKAYSRFPEFILPKLGSGKNNIMKNKNLLNKIGRLLTVPQSKGKPYSIEFYLISHHPLFSHKAFHYYPVNHSLEELVFINKKNVAYTNRCIIQKQRADFHLLISYRYTGIDNIYNSRILRLMLIDIGEVVSLFKQEARQLGLKTYSIPLYADQELNQILHLDGLKESVVYILAIKTKL